MHSEEPEDTQALILLDLFHQLDQEVIKTAIWAQIAITGLTEAVEKN